MCFKNHVTEVELPKNILKQLDLAEKKFKRKLTEKSTYRNIVRVLGDGLKLVVKKDKSCHGYFDSNKRIIYYSEGGRMTIFHELCHYLQDKAGCDTGIIGTIRLSNMLLMEQQCQAMAINLINRLYPKMRIPNHEYKCYFTIECAKFMENWYSQKCYFINDLENIDKVKKLSDLEIIKPKIVIPTDFNYTFPSSL